jgi:dienelactone hydrolase
MLDQFPIEPAGLIRHLVAFRARNSRCDSKLLASMRVFTLTMIAIVLATNVHAQKTVSFPAGDGGILFADVYGAGAKGLVLAHGGAIHNKESWTQEAQELAAEGFHVVAIDFRGYGKSHGPGDSHPMDAPLHLDILAAVRYLREHGAKDISIIGGSMGAGAAGDASIASKPGEISCVVMLGGAPNSSAEKLTSSSLYIVARDDTSGDGPRLPWIREQYEKSPQPKKLIILDGSAHAQALFQTKDSERVLQEITRFLSANCPRTKRAN